MIDQARDRDRDADPAAEEARRDALVDPAAGQAAGISTTTVAKAWRDYGIKPWRAESFRFSTDPELIGKVTDVVRPVPGPARERDRALCR